MKLLANFFNLDPKEPVHTKNSIPTTLLLVSFKTMNFETSR
jgi:hypothetical protein